MSECVGHADVCRSDYFYREVAVQLVSGFPYVRKCAVAELFYQFELHRVEVNVLRNLTHKLTGGEAVRVECNVR